MNKPGDDLIAVVYNNIPGAKTRSLQPGLGFSAFVQFKQQKFLFDTGADATILTNNARALGLDLADLDGVIISHNHWDHVYGLPAVGSRAKERLRIFVPGSARASIEQQNPRAEVIAVNEPVEILPQVWSSGPLETRYGSVPLAEQAMVLAGDHGLYVLTGCAHPGIVRLVERAQNIFAARPILLVAGGFHLADADAKEIREISSRLRRCGVRDIAPSHCTGGPAMESFHEEWGDHYRRLYLGHTYRL